MSRRRLLPTTLAALLLAAPLLTQAGPPAPNAAPADRGAPAKARQARQAGPAVHPATGADPATQDCAECHEAATPTAFKAWSDSRHGEAMVKCLVCHGDAGKSFTKAPPPARCVGCHAAQVASVTPAKGAAPSCFSCHDHHALTVAAGRTSPHGRSHGGQP
jgi:hypothetical protein